MNYVNQADSPIQKKGINSLICQEKFSCVLNLFLFSPKFWVTALARVSSKTSPFEVEINRFV